jgi:hypothetical protein
LNPEGLAQKAAGWWSPALPTVPNASINVHMQVQAEGLEPISPNSQGIVAWIRFMSLTGQYVTQKIIFDRDKNQGTFDWEKRDATVTVPEHTSRFALFFGIGACRGKARFADIRINTLSAKDK